MSFTIYLDEKEIGFTELENGDPPMGVVFGRIKFTSIPNPYKYFINYSKQNKLIIRANDEKIGFISTSPINGLKVISEKGIEIKGQGTYIDGNNEEMNINIWYIPYPFYEEQFPKHVINYNQRFGKTK